jgi:hypothetical protein
VLFACSEWLLILYRFVAGSADDNGARVDGCYGLAHTNTARATRLMVMARRRAERLLKDIKFNLNDDVP